MKLKINIQSSKSVLFLVCFAEQTICGFLQHFITHDGLPENC